MLKELIKDSTKLFSSQVIGIGLSVITAIAVARMLGPEGRGVYAWTMTFSAIAMQISLMGTDITCKRIAGQDPKEVPGLMNYSITLGILVAIPVALIGFIYGQWTSIGSKHTAPLILALLSIPFMAWTTSFVHILIGANRVGRSAGTILLPKLLLIIIFAVLILTHKVNLYTVMIANLAATILGCIITYITIKNLYELNLNWNLSYLKGMWKYSASAYISMILFFIMSKIDIIMIGEMLNTAETGQYAIAVTMTDIMITPAAALGTMLMVKLLSGAHSKEEKETLHRKALFITASVVVLGCIFTALIAPWLVPFMFGEVFEPAARILQILCIAVLFLSLYLIEQNRITALGRARHMLTAPAVGAIANISMNLYLIPLYGTHGAAWASVISYGLAWGTTIFMKKSL